jgi:IclR family transcriptional regulator, acetate operon repressor
VNSTSHVKSAARALDVLELLAGARRPVPTMVVARECDLPKSSAHRLLNMLRDRGWVTYQSQSRGWMLGPAAHIVTEGPRERLCWIAGPVLDELARTAVVTAQLAVREGTDVVFLDRRSPAGQAPRLRSVPGVAVPALRTAAGRALLMHLSPAQLCAMFSAPALVPELAAARAHGVAELVGGLTAGVRCLAAPVPGPAGAPIAALALSMSADSPRPELELVLRCAAARLADEFAMLVTRSGRAA